MSKKYFFIDDNGDRYPEWTIAAIAELFEGKNSNLVVSNLSKSVDTENTYKVYGASGIAGYTNSFQQEDKYISVIKDGAGVGRLTLCEAKTSIVGTMTALLPKKTCHLEFGFYLLQNNNLASDVSGSTIPHIYFKDYSKKKVEVPSLAEQQKIAEFFGALDERIALTAEKVRLLKEQKQGYLQRVFSGDMAFTDDNGNPYPAWEQKKLGEVAAVIMGQSPDGKSYSEDKSDMVLIQGNADMKNGHIVPRIYTSQPTKTCEAGDIIMSVRAPVGAFAKTDIQACLGRGVCAIRANDYIYQYLKYHSIIGGWSKLAQGSTFEAVSSTDVKTLSIPFPSLPEQVKIAEFFSALDEQIELTENKLTLLKEQKKGYLQGIFG